MNVLLNNLIEKNSAKIVVCTFHAMITMPGDYGQ